jgi:hypothetical protein
MRFYLQNLQSSSSILCAEIFLGLRFYCSNCSIVPLTNQVLLFYFYNLFYYSQNIFLINCVCFLYEFLTIFFVGFVFLAQLIGWFCFFNS